MDKRTSGVELPRHDQGAGLLRAGAALAAGAMLCQCTPHAGSRWQYSSGKPGDSSPVDARLLPGFRVEKVRTSGATLHTVIGGSGPPLLLIHGAPLTHLSWFRVAPELAKKYTVIAPDLRGYGDSSKPEDGENHSQLLQAHHGAGQGRVDEAFRLRPLCRRRS